MVWRQLELNDFMKAVRRHEKVTDNEQSQIQEVSVHFFA